MTSNSASSLSAVSADSQRSESVPQGRAGKHHQTGKWATHSSMRKIADAAEKANSDRQVKRVVFRGEKRL
jgi:hypothetical protein